MNTEAKFKIGDRVQQHATHPDRTYVGFVERIALTGLPKPGYFVRWHRGYASWEVEADIEPSPAA